MKEIASPPMQMILPPDGRQIRLVFENASPDRKHVPEWWAPIANWFKPGHKINHRLDFFAQQLEKEGYSERSREVYLTMMRRFFTRYDHLDPSEITMAEIEDYNYEYFVSGRYSRSYQLQFISALRHYFELTEGIRLNLKHLRKTGLQRKRTGSH